ncbi:MAG: inorganic diphosphatase [Coxiella sp. (in: Bacteria)]|nr:MAG: inorganic diphosphatase [Coxiella sp. (in: g-proteobacteria)]
MAPANSVPDDINVIIEVPAHADPVKYEVDKDTGLLEVDRFIPTAMHYPCNYGFVPNTLAGDGDPVDVLVIAPLPVQPGAFVRCRALGVLQMTDESGEDAKVIAVPIKKVCMHYEGINKLEDLSKVMLDSIVHFFEHYKDLEPNKWVKVSGFGDIKAAAEEINKSIERYKG